MKITDVLKWDSLAVVVLIAFGLSGCGTEIGNGFSADDGVTNKDEPRESSAANDAADSPEISDNVMPAEDQVGGSSDDDFDESDAQELAAPLVPGTKVPLDVILAECGSAFGDDIALLDYVIQLDDDKGYYVELDSDSWILYLDQKQKDVFRWVVPGDNDTVEISSSVDDDWEVAPTKYVCQNRQTKAEDSIKGDDDSYRSVSVLITRAEIEYRVKWYVNAGDKALRQIIVYQDDVEPVILEVVAP